MDPLPVLPTSGFTVSSRSSAQTQAKASHINAPAPPGTCLTTVAHRRERGCGLVTGRQQLCAEQILGIPRGDTKNVRVHSGKVMNHFFAFPWTRVQMLVAFSSSSNG